MFNKSLALALSFALVTSVAFAADAPEKKKKKKKVAEPAPVVETTSDFDFAFGAAVKSRYVSRGISNSATNPAANAYGEVRYKEIFYTNVTYNTDKLPQKPSGEVDISAGARPVFGKLTTDIGAMYYWYPGASIQQYNSPASVNYKNITGFVSNGLNPVLPGQPNYVEGYIKPTYALTDTVTLGANVFYSPSWSHTGAYETYTSGTAKVTLPYDLAVSGEFGHQFFGTSKAYIGAGTPVKYQGYNTWNAGITYTYKQASLDLRYSGTDLNKADCFAISADPKGYTSGTGRSKWCGNTFLATLSVDFVYSELTKK
jgi:Bacterial protein of unknown function (Gcw_chp)